MKNLERSGRRIRAFATAWIAFVALVTVVIFGLGIWAVVSLVSDPAQIGHEVGEIVNGYEETAQ